MPVHETGLPGKIADTLNEILDLNEKMVSAGVNIPEDVSIVGIDDISFACLARPPLTTIRVDREGLGVTAFQALQRMLKLKRQRGSEYSLETELVIRKSTAPARKRKLRLEKGKG
jgi:DNA-binding LacI/PurR family transcriptional regulator